MGESDEDSDDEDGNFFNDMHGVNVEGERATWHLVTLTGKKEVGEKKKRRKEKGDEGDEEAMEDDNVERLEDLALEETGPTTVTVESGAFTVSSTVGEKEKDTKGATSADVKEKDCFVPSPRFGSQMVYKGGSLYLFGGVIESREKDITLKDFYSLDTNKNDSWNVVIESDQVMEWLGETDDDEDDEDEDDDEDDESGMDTD